MNIRHIAAIAAALVSTTASATTIYSHGTFTNDNDKASVTFTIKTAQMIDFVSLGFAGGISATAHPVKAGGFDTILSIYDSAGNLVVDNDDGASAPIDAVTGRGADAAITQLLAAGTYTVYLTQYANFGPLQLVNGFAFDGVPDFAGGFVDISGAQRTGHWAFDIRNIAPVPEAATSTLLLAGMGLLGVAARRRRV